MEESEMSEGKYTVKDNCIVSRNGSLHAPFDYSHQARLHCDELNAGKANATHWFWDPASTCAEHGPKPVPEPDAITITHDHVFRDRDWGLGMFDADNPHVVVDEDRIWLMIGTDPVAFGKKDPFLGAIEARAIAAMLVAAADFLEGCDEN
jgi:hypothetical protein